MQEKAGEAGYKVYMAAGVRKALEILSHAKELDGMVPTFTVQSVQGESVI